MARFSYFNIKGSDSTTGARVDGIVLKDNDSRFLFFLSKDLRLHDCGWVFGGIPISLCPDENYWNNVCRYNLGVKSLSEFAEAIRECGCGTLKNFNTWTIDSSRNGGNRMEVDALTTAEMDAMLDYTIAPSRVAPIRVAPNTDYECATPVYPWRTGDARVGAAPTTTTITNEETGTSTSVPSSISDIISDGYEKDIMYTGFSSYHAHHNDDYNKAIGGYGANYMVGVELEVECNNSTCKSILNRTKSNWFYQERDGSLGDYGVEIITIPLKPSDAHNVEFWKALTEPVGRVAKSWDKTTTGLHVHISRTILGDDAESRSETLGKLLYFYHHLVLDGGNNERINTDVYGRAHTYHEHIGKSETGKAAKMFGSTILKHKDVTERVKTDMIRISNSDRYFDINIYNSDTIEFRKGKGSIKAERIASVVAWSELMCLYCKKTKWENLSFDGFRSFVRDSHLAPDALKARV